MYNYLHIQVSDINKICKWTVTLHVKWQVPSPQIALGGMDGTSGLLLSRLLLNFILERKDLVDAPIAGRGWVWVTITVFSCSLRISAAADVSGSLISVLEKSIEWCLDLGLGEPRLRGGGGVGVYRAPVPSSPPTFICINLALCILDIR